MLSAKEIRESFKDFFANKGHQIVPSAPMVIKDDPTLMFTNAGMNQFKDVILGNASVKYPRVADSQKCLRVSGKHNDLEEVGHDTYHHTMFEMLGNWSFGDYFKKEAIDWAWEYLVGVLKLDPNRLYATVFEGYQQEGLERDDEAASYWEQYLPKDRILNGNKKDNFWEMGDTGPCGPCSEIHIDIRPDQERALVDGLTLVNESHPQVIEIWNLVFMQYNRKADGSLEPLPARVIDTGMGFERLCMAIQGKLSNYDTDVFQPLIQEIARLSSMTYGRDEKADIAMRVIADHIRTISFSIADSQLPSNAKAGYVIRRILRRAVRYGYTFLGQQQSFMYKLVAKLIDTMGDAYPELVAQRVLIERVIKEEEESFLRTLETGIKLLDKLMADSTSRLLSGKDVFTLYDTYGFPLDLTELILNENGYKADIDGFNDQMAQQRKRARNAATVETGDWIVVHEGDSEFVGYDLLECQTQILRYRTIKQKGKESYQVVIQTNPFYGESGGQAGDIGMLTSDHEKVRVVDAKKENNLIVLYVAALPKDPTADFVVSVSKDHRIATARNHTATHLIHEALREILGTHVEQRGSYVSSKILRFDFSHFQKMTQDELHQLERLVNKKVMANISKEECRALPIDQAREMGAMALFGEKYGEQVRVIKYGSSVELCGGTHVAATGEIGLVRILSESSIAAGIRRIEAITGVNTQEYLEDVVDTLVQIKLLFNNAPSITQSIQKVLAESAEMRSALEKAQEERIRSVKQSLITRHQEVDGIKIFTFRGMMLPDAAKKLALMMRTEFTEKMFFVAGTIDQEKPLLTVALSDDLVANGFNASNLVKLGATLILGAGGGQPHFASAGGKNIDQLSAAVDLILKEAGLSN